MEYDKNGCFSCEPDYYAPQVCEEFTFEAEGNVLVDVEKYHLKF